MRVGTDRVRALAKAAGFACAAIRNPSGKTAVARESVGNIFVHTAERTPAGGLWRMDFSKGAQPNYDWITLDLYGVPGTVFLSKEKIWRMK